jgi:SAM-dependent methyltransferase
MDLGAGRGAGSDSPSRFVRDLLDLRGKVKHVIGIDIDPSVLSNPHVDEAKIYDGVRLPIEDASIDLILSDNTLEHVSRPDIFTSEVARVLKPGGWFCARTPNFYSALVLASSVVPNSAHQNVLSVVQPQRLADDIFPTVYKLNTMRKLKRYFSPSKFEHYCYTWSPEPAYYMNSKIIFFIWLIYQWVKQPFLGGEVLLAFIRKSDGASTSIFQQSGLPLS